MRRVEADEPREASWHPSLGVHHADPVATALLETELDARLPHDHPKWRSDTLTVSQRARALIAHLKPVAIRVLSFWDHRIRSAFIAGSRIGIDASGSYRLE